MAHEVFNLGLIGWPLEHSLSPVLHGAALRAAGLTGSYRLYPVQPMPEGEQALQHYASLLRMGEIDGLNVTIPHKQAVLSVLDRLTPGARAVGAVNTIYMEGVALSGDNTDVQGFLAGLTGLKLRRCHTAIVLGAGGAARAVVYALALSWRRIYIAGRTLFKARRIAEDLAGSVARSVAGPEGFEIIPLPLTDKALRKTAGQCDLLVNATPVGMAPASEASPWPADLPLPPGAAVYDLVYNPRQTALVLAARSSDLPAIGGLEMLVEQAALAFERWTGQPASRAAMQAAVDHSNDAI